jgi:hypothetical protein
MDTTDRTYPQIKKYLIDGKTGGQVTPCLNRDAHSGFPEIVLVCLSTASELPGGSLKGVMAGRREAKKKETDAEGRVPREFLLNELEGKPAQERAGGTDKASARMNISRYYGVPILGLL